VISNRCQVVACRRQVIACQVISTIDIIIIYYNAEKQHRYRESVKIQEGGTDIED